MKSDSKLLDYELENDEPEWKRVSTNLVMNEVIRPDKWIDVLDGIGEIYCIERQREVHKSGRNPANA